MKNSEEENPRRQKIPGVANSGQQKKETRRRLRSRQVQLTIDESVKKSKDDVSTQMLLAKLIVKLPINLSLIPIDSYCNETYQKLLDRAREIVPETVLRLLRRKLFDKFGRPYLSFVAHLLKNIWLNVHLRCLREDAGLSDEGMAEMHPLHLLKFFDGVNDTHTPSEERAMKALVTEFGLHTPGDIITELVEKMVKAYAKIAPRYFALVARQDASATVHEMSLALQGISLAGQ